MTDVIEVYGEAQVIEQVTAEPYGSLVVEQTLVQVVEVITPGPTGPRGETGEPGTDLGITQTYERHFASAVDLWVINHPLHTYPEVTTVDLNGMEIIGDVAYPSFDQVIVMFAMPVAGTARLKA